MSPIAVPIAFVALASIAQDGRAQELTSDEVRAVETVVESYADVDTPGFVWALWRDGAIVSSGARGMADLEREVPLSVDSRLRIASTSKQFTAASILALVEDGALDLETPVHELIEELHAFDPPVRLRHLVAHQSGLPDYLFLMDLKGYPPQLPYTSDEVLDVLSRIEDTVFEPGSNYAYSNTNYLLMSEIVRRTSGSTLRAFAHERIFAPLGMQSTHFCDDRDELIPSRALAYERDFDGTWRLSLTPLELVGDGGVFTTVEDLFRWTQDMRVERADRVGVFDVEAVERQTAPFALDGGRAGDYAFGLLIENVSDGRLVSHGGAFVGYRADCLHCPEAGWGVAVLFNRADGRPTEVGFQLLDAIGVDTRLVSTDDDRDPFDTDAQVPPLPDWARALNGEMLLSDGTPVRVRRVGEFLRVHGPSVDVQLAAPASEATRLVNRDASVSLAATELGLVFDLGGGALVRLEQGHAPPPAREGYGVLGGRWRVHELDAVWDFVRRDTRREAYDVVDARGLRGRVTPVGRDLARGPQGSLIWRHGDDWRLWAPELGVLRLSRLE